MNLLRSFQFGRTMYAQSTTAIRRPSKRTTVRWMAALLAVTAPSLRAMTAMFRSSSIILRKVRGISGLSPMWRTASGAFGSAPTPGSVVGFLTSPLVLLAIGLLILLAWFLADPGAMHAGALLATAPAVIVEKREELHTKQKTMMETLELAGKDVDLSKKSVQERLGATDADDALLKFKALDRELKALGDELRSAELKEIARATREREEEIKMPREHLPQPEAYDANGKKKSWGQRFVESKEFKASRANRQDVPLLLEDIGVKTLFQTSAGYPIENVRSGLLVEGATRPVQVTDLIPSFPIGQASFVYMEETTRTHASAEKAEGAAYAESTFVWEQKTSPVQKITDSIPVTDEQLEDEAQVRSILEQRLAFGLRQRLDLQILVGNGTPPNLRGMTQVVGIQTQALGADSRIVAFLRALTKIRFTGRASPSGAVFHPNDWLDIMLTQDAEGRFLFGNPFQGAGPNSLFGIPVAQSDALTENTGLVADFANFTRLDDRRGVMVQTGYVGSNFTEGKVTLRADMRAAFTVTRPAAVCTITGI